NIFIYNILGQKVAAFNRAVQTAGMDEFEFNARNLSSGIYFYQIILNSVTGQKFESKVGKMMLMK
ncbi:MAG TPA: T9SS type A sorting domain-containing protein, partial [Ignavibacteriales bacterium]|nr:T9SS type A sorting domain-containing protein [Ignavibacteriales bacterium]